MKPTTDRYRYIECLKNFNHFVSVSWFACLYPINIKTAERIRPKFL